MSSRGRNGLAWALLAIAGGEGTAHACEVTVPVVDAGDELARVCPDAAEAMGFTLVDLSEQWAPLPFSPAETKPPKFRDTYLALAAGDDPDGGELAPEEKLVEMYGITPAPSVVLARLNQDKRHACHAAIDNTALGTVKKDIKETGSAQAEVADRKRRALGKALEKERKRRNLASVDEMVNSKSWKARYLQWRRLQDQHDAVVAMQLHLVCEKLMSKKYVDGKLTGTSSRALDLYQRNHFLLPDGNLSKDTAEAMAVGELEQDFRAALRMLRERVVDATGLIEDGTAAEGPLPVLGRQLEPDIMQRAKGRGPLEGGAADLIDPATELAAVALGWTTPETARDWLAHHKGEQLLVAIALPPPPTYHSANMQLHAVLDRGDVWYDLKPRSHTPQRRPSLVLYAKGPDGVEHALVQWPTTIGGWNDEKQVGGWVKKEWKESDVGPRVWKELYVAPTWQPPKTTPDDDLVKNLYNGKYRLKTEILGPGPRSAYGMVMLIHHKPVKIGKKRVAYGDNGIRVHGSASVTSVVRGVSHGCHRLLNHLAVRLGGFLIRHHAHVVKGDQRASYKRIVKWHGTYEARVKTRGFLYELTPPIPIEVTKGRIRSDRKKPPPKRR